MSGADRGAGIVTRDGAVELAGRLRGARRVVVFTNGVFDLLHPGHVRYLQQARALGAALIVGINSDRSVRAIKGPARPVTPEAERAEIVAALACVDAAVIFDEETPHAIIAAIEPDVLVKGADWAEDAVVGRDVVEARGGRVVRMPVEAGYSTSAILDRLRRRAQP
ncbi:MAG: D-glycero-beta-D-manno-heptose 1-phosphate adenylyltransferase [Acidobacteria bacterium]|nr:D-glycero-beta-D-manno-heptose 1-phosphate adenylyltransferase [Acidobacteriota bacterium]